VAALAGLLREDVTLEMPPLLTWFAGRQAVTGFLASRAFTEPGRFLLVPVMANGQPAFAVYERDGDGPYQAYGVTVPEVTATGIARIVTFFDPGLFGSFGLPQEHDAAAGPGPGPGPA
jgi:RNA polymerase sigma-70 factor, ECF subfamily